MKELDSLGPFVIVSNANLRPWGGVFRSGFLKSTEKSDYEYLCENVEFDYTGLYEDENSFILAIGPELNFLAIDTCRDCILLFYLFEENSADQLSVVKDVYEDRSLQTKCLKEVDIPVNFFPATIWDATTTLNEVENRVTLEVGSEGPLVLREYTFQTTQIPFGEGLMWMISSRTDF
ncbi:MAG: hypothetical protein ABJN14_12910 [Paracoccaceae bacterium]